MLIIKTFPTSQELCQAVGELGKQWLLCSPSPVLPGALAEAWCFLWEPVGAGPPGNLWGPLKGTRVKTGGRGAGRLMPDQGSEGAGVHPYILPGPSGATGRKELLLTSSQGYRALCLVHHPPMGHGLCLFPRRHVI